MTLFIGTFSVFTQDDGTNSTINSLSREVITYEKTIKKYADQYGILDYVPLIQAVMMQESRRLGNDPMQSSECAYNIKFPKVHNGIDESKYSIDCGVHTLADCIKAVKVSSPSDTQHIYLAFQGYNYGNGYISWVISNFGVDSKYNAKLFSDNKKKELNTNVYGEPNYVNHVCRMLLLHFEEEQILVLTIWTHGYHLILMLGQVYVDNAHGLPGQDFMSYMDILLVSPEMDGTV